MLITIMIGAHLFMNGMLFEEKRTKADNLMFEDREDKTAAQRAGGAREGEKGGTWQTFHACSLWRQKPFHTDDNRVSMTSRILRAYGPSNAA